MFQEKQAEALHAPRQSYLKVQGVHIGRRRRGWEGMPRKMVATKAVRYFLQLLDCKLPESTMKLTL